MRERLAEDLPLPAGYFFGVGGRVESQARATRALLVSSAIAVLAVFLLLYRLEAQCEGVAPPSQEHGRMSRN